MKTTIPIFLILILFLIAFLGACSTGPTPPTISGDPDGIQTATGRAGSESSDKELKIQTGASQEGAVNQNSADVRNQEEVQSTTSGHIQTLGFAGIGNAAQAIKDDPVMTSIQLELEKLMGAEDLDTARIDKLRSDMVARAVQIQDGMAATAPRFDGLKTIVAIFTMENATGHEKTPLTDAAAASKADAFKAALAAIGDALDDKGGGQ